MERKKRTAPKQNKDLTGNCHKCGKPVTQDSYCHGCKEYVCEECDVSCGNTPMGRHDVEDHYIDPDEADPRD